MAAHPFAVLYELGFLVSVNVDNRTVSNTSLTSELHRLSRAFDYDIADVAQFQINAAHAAFAPLHVQQQLAQVIRDAIV